MQIFVINGHKYYPWSQGQLNKTLFDGIIATLSDHEVKTTVVEQGYDVEAEIEKFLWADVIIFQTPVNWFALPGMFKSYMDEIYRYGVFYGPSDEYGRGGLLKGKRYMYSLTMNSPEEAFGKTGGFYDGRGLDELIVALHKLQEFCGLEKIPTFAAYDVVKNPNIELYKQQLREHLQKHLL
jgi:modulator of drug activity B